MPDNDSHTGLAGSGLDRRSFVGGLSGLLAASAFSLSVPDATAAQVRSGDDEPTQTVRSPDGRLAVTVDVADGTPTYRVTRDGDVVVADSALGFAFEEQSAFGADGAAVAVTGTERASVDDAWEPVWDQYATIEERYEELRIGLAESGGAGRALTVEVRAFDDGVGLRYVFPAESGFGEFAIASEQTEFAMPGDPTAWWIQHDFNSYEYEYSETALSALGAESPTGGAHTPITMRHDDGRYVSLHEANLVDYAGMGLEPASAGSTTLEAELAPLPSGTKVTASAPHRTPWRTIQVGDSPGDLVESNLVVNLNDERDPEEFPQGTDWIEPKKFIGVWWLMITGRADWQYTGPESGNHGAQTERVKRYMEFASEHDIPSVLVEGWNEGWDSYPGDGSTMDFDAPYPDFDWDGVLAYGDSLSPSVNLTAHNETAGNVSNYEAQLTSDDSPFATYDDKGIRSIKTGYVADSGVSIDGTTYNHHCQPLVNHHNLVYREAATNRQLLEVHEPIKPTGERRRYPNVLTREGVLGQEYDAFGNVSPDHHVTFPFTRMLGGPVEYTPGIFDMESGAGGIETTRAKQLAMYPTYFSGLQMVADLPSSYLADQPAVLRPGEVTQAEFGDSDGFPTGAKWAGAQGERYVPIDPNRADAGSTLSFDVEGVEAGEYALHLRYASDAENNAVPADTDRTATVVANGDSQQVAVSPTDYWDQWTTASVTVELAGDDDSVAIELGADDTGGFNLDAVALTAPGAAMPEPDTAPIRGETVDAFDFIEDVPAAGWDDTAVVDAEIGEYSVTARRKGDEWYVGAMTNGDGRAVDVPMDFLAGAPAEKGGTGKNGKKGKNGKNGKKEKKGKKNGNGRGNGGGSRGAYVLELYSDGIDGGLDADQTDVRVDEAIVTPGKTVLASMAASGGTAMRLRPAESDDLAELPRYERPEQTVAASIDAETFVQEPFVAASGENFGDYIGGTTVELVVDGGVAATENIRLPPNDTGEVAFSYSIDAPGEYDVAVRTTDGDTLARRTVTVKPPETVAELADPSGDDVGPGSYTYPTADAFRDGAFDLEAVRVSKTPSLVSIEFEAATLYNAFGSGRGFSPHMFLAWLRDPSSDSGSTSEVGDLGLSAGFEAPWQYRLEVSGFTKSAVDANGQPLTDADGNAVTPVDVVDTDAGTVKLTLPRSALDGTDPADLELVAAVGSEDFGGLRNVAVDAGSYTFGGAKPDAEANAPSVLDVVTPDGTSQSDALAYDADTLATLPFVPLGDG